MFYELWIYALPMLIEDTQRGVWFAVALGPAAVLAIVTVMIVLYLGFEGSRFPTNGASGGAGSAPGWDCLAPAG